MRLAILEWICGGGLTLSSAPLDHALLQEGWQMLRTLVAGLTAAGHEVVVPLDQRLMQQSEIAETICQWQSGACRVELRWIPSLEEVVAESQARALIDGYWLACCEDCDYGIVIAPEFDNILADSVRILAGRGVQLINCEDPLLALAANKLHTADRLQAAGCSHPPTQVVDKLSQGWLDRIGQQCGTTRWVIKPVDGAGCDGLLVTDDPQAAIAHRLLRPGLIVQPWIEGLAYSCSAVVDRHGDWHWQPLVTQEFSRSVPESHVSSTGLHAAFTLKYIGARPAKEQSMSSSLKEMLERMVVNMGAGAWGWVGVDLLYRPEADEWVIIEINPRCTTSMCHLATLYRGNYVADFMAAAIGSATRLPGEWLSWDAG